MTGEAKQHFSEVVRQSADEPQRIFNRDRLVAAVISADAFLEFVRWQEASQRRTLGDAFDEVREICAQVRLRARRRPPARDRTTWIDEESLMLVDTNVLSELSRPTGPDPQRRPAGHATFACHSRSASSLSRRSAMASLGVPTPRCRSWFDEFLSAELPHPARHHRDRPPSGRAAGVDSGAPAASERRPTC